MASFCAQHLQRADPDKPTKAGVTALHFSPSGNWLAARDGSFPKHVFLYCLADSMEERKGLRAVLQYEQPVECIAWRPIPEGDLEVLLIAYGVKALGLWFSDDGQVGRAEGFGVPASALRRPLGLPLTVATGADFTVKSVRWAPKGNMVLLKGKDSWCAAYPLGAQ
jgi:hypothetical protein